MNCIIHGMWIGGYDARVNIEKDGSTDRIYPNLYKFENYRVPQARHRVIIIGIRDDLPYDFRIPSTGLFQWHLGRWDNMQAYTGKRAGHDPGGEPAAVLRLRAAEPLPPLAQHAPVYERLADGDGGGRRHVLP